MLGAREDAGGRGIRVETQAPAFVSREEVVLS